MVNNTAPKSHKIRTVFLGTPEIARNCLAALFESGRFEIVGVVSQPDRPAGRKMQLQPSAVKKLALEKSVEVITPEKMTPDAIEKVRGWKAECAIVVAFGQILPQSFLDLLPGNIVNLHTSLLPRWRGAAPVQRAIMAGDKETGVCLQVMVKKLDAGDIIASAKVAIDDQVNALEMLDVLGAKGSALINEEFPKYLNRSIEAYAVQKQDEAFVTYAHKIDKAESQLDWKLSSREVHNKVRGMTLGPGTYTLQSGKKVKIHKTQIVDESKPGQPGRIVAANDKGIEVECSSGRLLILEIQPESRPKMSVKDYLLGHAVSVGEQLG